MLKPTSKLDLIIGQETHFCESSSMEFNSTIGGVRQVSKIILSWLGRQRYWFRVQLSFYLNLGIERFKSI